MAYENGDEVVDYIGNVIEKYRQDNMIFYKSLQLLQIFMSRPDWPYCINELDESTSQVLGQSFFGLVFGFTQRYLHEEYMIWPEDLPKGFKEELTALHIAIDPLVRQFWMEPLTSHKLFSVALSNDIEKQSIRVIRQDGQYLDLTMEENEINNFIRLLNEMLMRNAERKVFDV